MPVKRNISETSSSTKESNKTPKILKAVRKNIETLSDKELKRYLAALSRMQLNAITDPYNDWWNLNAIHGGNFRQAVEAGLRPAYAQYLKDYTPVDLVNNFDEQDWQIGGFCAHSIPTFLVWHRVYVQAFELLLQHYDPEPNSAEGPLAAHYWHWDAPAYKLPDAATQTTITDYFGKEGIDNPLLLGPTGIRSLKNVPYTVRGNFQSVPLVDLDQGYRAFHTVSEYSRMSTKNSNPFSFEDPHNQLHNQVGGDMSNVPVSSFDPIFWLHHSNVERMHYAWIQKWGVPDHVWDYSKDKPTDLINLRLYPFAPKENFTYDQLPWKVNNNGTMVWSTVKEWLDNSSLSYNYDDVEHVGVPSAHGLQTIFSLEEGLAEKTTALQKKFIYLNNVKVSGSGVLHVGIKITNENGRETHALLPTRPLFSRTVATCANCAWKVENYVWVVHISEAVLGLVEANLKSLHPLGKGLLLLSSSTGKNQAAIAADFVRFEKQDDNGQTVAVEDVPYDSIELLSQLKHTTK